MAVTVPSKEYRDSWPIDAWINKLSWKLRGTESETIEDSITDIVGADNLPESHYSDVFSFEEKASIRIWGLFLRNNEKEIKKLFKTSLLGNFHDPAHKKRSLIRLFLPLNFDPYYYDPKSQIQNKNIYNQIVFNEFYHNPDDQCAALNIQGTLYSDYSFDNAYSTIPLPLSSINKTRFTEEYSDINAFNNHFYSFLNIGFPRILSKDLRFPLFSSLSPSIKLFYVFRGEKPEDSMLLIKHFVCVNNCFVKIYIPAVFLRDKHGDINIAFACLPKAKKHKLFSGEHLPLYNSFGIKRIEEADKVVICGSIEDADTLQRQNDKNRKYAFAAFVCDPGCFYQIDFSPLKNKSVEFLISNHSAQSLDKERSFFVDLYHFLRDRKNRIKDFSFREREVIYPQRQLTFPSDYCNLYSKYRPRIVSNKIYSEAEFEAKYEKGTIHAENIAPGKELTEKTNTRDGISERSHTGRPKHLNLTAEKTILRPFIRRGCTTVLVGDPQIGKSRFAYALAAQVAGSKSEFLKDRLWTRCLSSDGEKTRYKVVYWVFDDVDKDDIQLQRNFFARGLSCEQDRNLFIEPARSFRKRDCENLKAELKKYTSQGMRDHPVDFLVIDTLLSFARSPAKIFSAFEELVRLKDELPGLAILVLHHKSKEGNPYGGILATNMPRVIIEMKRDNSSVLDDLEVPITINVIKHSNEHAGIDILPFEIKLDDDHFIVTNNSSLPLEKVRKLVIHEYKNNRLESFSNTDIGRLLGVGRKPIETIWKNDDTKDEVQVLWDSLKAEYKEKAKALNESASKKKNRKKSRGRASSRIEDEEREEDEEDEEEYNEEDLSLDD